ncbi:hypothetical protein [Moraxella boevrei]
MPDGLVIVVKRDLENNPMLGELGVDNDKTLLFDVNGKFIKQID